MLLRSKANEFPRIGLLVAVFVIASVGARNSFAVPGVSATSESNWYLYNATLAGVPDNARVDNGYNANCQGWSFQQAGFLDANGKPYPIDANGNIMNGNVVIGRRFAPGIFVSDVANAGVADLSGGGTLQAVYRAMLPFDQTQTPGLLHISTHGPVRVVNKQKKAGGLVILDNNTVFAGYRQPGTSDAGTNVPGFSPYEIAPVANTIGANGGGRFAVEQYNCNSGLDPDGAGSLLSVTATAATGFGTVLLNPNSTAAQRVTGVSGSVPVVSCTVQTECANLPQGITPLAFQGGIQNLMRGNRKKFNNTTDPRDWLAGFPMQDHYAKLADALGTCTPYDPTTGQITGNTFDVVWKVSYQQSTALSRGTSADAMDQPVIWSPSSDEAVVSYRSPSGTGLDSDFTITNVGGGNTTSGTTLHLCVASDVDVTAPAGLDLATSVMRLSPYADSFNTISGNASLDYVEGIDPDTIELYELVGGQWVPFSTSLTRTLDLVNRQIAADFSFAGAFDESDGAIVAGFGVEIPEPSFPALFACAGAAALGRRRRKSLAC